MAMQFKCAHCGETIKARAEQAGTTGQCPKCQAEYRVPTPKAKSTAKADEDFDPVAFLSETPAESHLEHSVPAAVSAEGDDRPSSARSQKSSGKSAAAVSDEPPNAAQDFWDQAQAAREMRKALKASVKEAKAKREDTGGGIDIEIRDLLREYAPKLIGAVLAVALLSYGLYRVFDSMLGGVKLPPLGKVTGVVTLDGQPLGNATVYFSPMEVEFDEGKRDRARTSIGITDSSGRFTMMYLQDVEGVAVGQCRVWLECMGPDGRPMIPAEYSQAAGQQREVSAGSQKIDFPMVSRRPGLQPKG